MIVMISDYGVISNKKASADHKETGQGESSSSEIKRVMIPKIAKAINQANQLYQGEMFGVRFVPGDQNLKFTNKTSTNLLPSERKIVTKMTDRREKDG